MCCGGGVDQEAVALFNRYLRRLGLGIYAALNAMSRIRYGVGFAELALRSPGEAYRLVCEEFPEQCSLMAPIVIGRPLADALGLSATPREVVDMVLRGELRSCPGSEALAGA
ncbi:MAG: hypothetical protein ABWW70_04720 [Thermoproteota archaeon]